MKRLIKFSSRRTERLIAVAFITLAATTCFFLFFLREITHSYSVVEGTPYVPETQVIIKEIVPENMVVNINTATLEELMTLNGIGEVTAGKIIEYRETNNGFINVDELLKVEGIGEAKLEKIRSYVTTE